jgi:hypothetical protein
MTDKKPYSTHHIGSSDTIYSKPTTETFRDNMQKIIDAKKKREAEEAKKNDK